MNIKFLDSWLREFVKTKATPQKVAEILSLTSISVDRLEPYKKDYLYESEVTTNRPDLMSIVGIARETAVVLPQFGIRATLASKSLSSPKQPVKSQASITIQNDPTLVNRILAVIMEVTLKDSPSYIQERLETSGIRKLNNLVDVTNYLMRELGHPAHVFDYDRLTSKKLIIRESRKGEKITTLDGKTHQLFGGDIVADNGEGEIVDLLGVMGTANSVVNEKTKRILFFINNNDPMRIRKTSMSLGIRTEAAVLNEKGVDPELAMKALFRGVQLYQETAEAKLISEVIDIYPNKPRKRSISVSEEKINKVIGTKIPQKTITTILESLGFKVEDKKGSFSVEVPSWRLNDVATPEDLIEEIARVYGYHRLPSTLPPVSEAEYHNMQDNEFYWEKRVKEAFKYWGFTEVYTYSMVSEELLEGPTEEAVELNNPLTEDMVYMRTSLVPNLLEVVSENKTKDVVKIFEIANVYQKIPNKLPKETLRLAGAVKQENVFFFEVKGIIEQLFTDLGIKDFKFRKKESGGDGAEISIGKEDLGTIEILEKNIIDFELDFEAILKYATLKKTYKPLAKFPPIIEDLRIEALPDTTYEQIVSIIKGASSLVVSILLLDVYENKRTFRITYQHPSRNLTNEEIAYEREKISSALLKSLKVKIA